MKVVEHKDDETRQIREVILSFIKELPNESTHIYKTLIEKHIAKPILSYEESFDWIKQFLSLVKQHMQEMSKKDELLNLEEQIKVKTEELNVKSNMLNSVLHKLEVANNERVVLDQSFTPIHVDEQKYIAQVVKRAIKLSCYVTNAESGVKYPSVTQGTVNEYWKFLNFFTKQMRSYIREAEEDKVRLAEFKKQKDEFIGYVEKEVSELTKSWNLVEEQKKKANQMLQKVIEREQSLFKETENKRDLIEADMRKVQKEKNELSREVTGLKVALENQKTTSEALNKGIIILRKSIESLTEDKKKLLADISKIKREEQSYLSELRDERERVKKEIERYKASLESIKQQEDRERFLLGLDREINIKEQELEKYSNKAVRYRSMPADVINESKAIQGFSDTCLFNTKSI